MTAGKRKKKCDPESRLRLTILMSGNRLGSFYVSDVNICLLAQLPDGPE